MTKSERLAVKTLLEMWILSAKIHKLREEKSNFVKQQKYQEAAIVRESEKILVKQIPEIEVLEKLKDEL